MSWSYSGDPSSTRLDELRFRIGDTDNSNPLLSDEELNFILSSEPNIAVAAYKAASIILTKLSQEYDQRVGDVDYALSQRYKQYADLVAQLRLEVDLLAKPYCGGISEADKERYETELDRVEPAFKRDLHEVVQWRRGRPS